MAYSLDYTEEADDALDALEADPSAAPALQAIYRTLNLLADDPFDPRLGTVPFVTPDFGGVCATPARYDDWYVIWQRGPEPQSVDVIAVARLPV
jgi:hypothetical protein